MTCSALAPRAGVHERYLREWLSHQAASGYLAYDPAAGTFALLPEQAMVFAVEDSPVYMMGGFDLHGGDARKPAQGAGRVQDRRRRAMGRPGGLHVLRRRPLLPPGLSQRT